MNISPNAVIDHTISFYQNGKDSFIEKGTLCYIDLSKYDIRRKYNQIYEYHLGKEPSDKVEIQLMGGSVGKIPYKVTKKFYSIKLL